MTIKQELINYAQRCIDDKITSCVKHKWACERFLNDIKRSEARNTLSEPFPYIWDEEKAQNIVDWFSMLKHTKGVLANEFIKLEVCQKFSICQIYGWRHEITGFKRFKNTFKEIGRKNAKSQEEAGIALYEMAVESTNMGEIYEAYCAGTKRDQSKIIFEECNNLLTGSPLRKKFKITRDKITHIKTGSFLKPLCKEDGKKGDGTNPAVLILDEYHQHQTTEFYDLGLGSNTKQSLLMIITTAGMDLNCPCYTQEYKYCSNILNPDVDINNDTYLVDIFELDSDDDIHCSENWVKANPIRMSYEKGIKDIKDFYEIAKNIPDKMTAFLTKILNVWVQQKHNQYMDMARWKLCEVDEIPFNTDGMPVYVGFDMSAKIDLTSVAFIIPVQTKEYDENTGKKIIKYICYSHSFVPNEAKLQEREFKDKAPFRAWAMQKYITVTNTEIVDQNAVMRYVLDICKRHNWQIQCLCFDPANASKLMMDLSNEGYNVVEVYQSHKSLNEATAGYREQTYSGNIIYTLNPVLNFAMANAVTRTNNGLIKIDKDAAKQRIDPVDAMLAAFKLAYYHEFVNTSEYDEWLDEEW